MTAIHPKTGLLAPEHYWIVSAGVVAAVAVGYFRESVFWSCLDVSDAFILSQSA